MGQKEGGESEGFEGSRDRAEGKILFFYLSVWLPGKLKEWKRKLSFKSDCVDLVSK